MARYAVHVCGGDLRERVEPGYVDWHEWAGRLVAKRHKQTACPGCGRYLIWLPKPDALEARPHPDTTGAAG